jgi:hypothetical protein
MSNPVIVFTMLGAFVLVMWIRLLIIDRKRKSTH